MKKIRIGLAMLVMLSMDSSAFIRKKSPDIPKSVVTLTEK
jgi:hypothetical protein